MMHLDDDRLLALSRAIEPDADERRHLGECDDCRGRLAIERRLHRALTASAALQPSPAFARLAVRAFAEAQQRAERRQLFFVAAASLLAAALCALVLVVTSVAALNAVVYSAAMLVKQLVIAVDLAATLARGVPGAPLLLLLGYGGALVLAAGAIARLGRAEALK